MATPGILAVTATEGIDKPFLFPPHLQAVDREFIRILRAAEHGEPAPILGIEMPPRHGKSTWASLWLVVWYLCMYPDREVMLFSATADLAEEFSGAARDKLATIGPGLFDVGVSRWARSSTRWHTTHGGKLWAAGVKGSSMGRGADLLIVDDYFGSFEDAMSAKNREDVYRWFVSVALPRLSPRGCAVILATRWGVDDLIGRADKVAEAAGRSMRVVGFPALATDHDTLGRKPGEALWPDRFPVGHLEATRRTLTESGYEWMWAALYQGDPPDSIDTEWPPHYFREDIWFDEWPRDDKIIGRFMSFDPSVGESEKGDFSAFVMLVVDSELNCWIDADLARRDIHVMMADGIQLLKRFRPSHFGVEATCFQAILAPLYDAEARKQRVFTNVLGLHQPPGLGKIGRIRSRLTAPLAQGRLRFRRRSPGASLLVEQLKAFPSKRAYRDGPDALEMALRVAIEVLQKPRMAESAGQVLNRVRT